MKNELHGSLDKIHADDDLKERTAHYLSMEINKRNASRKHPRFRLAFVCTAFLIFTVLGGLAYYLNFTSIAYVDVDVNPSIGLTLNRFNRVIKTQAYNDAGTTILSDANIRFKTYNEATQILLDKIISNGYLFNDGLVSVTVQVNSDKKEADMLGLLNQVVNSSLLENHVAVQTDVFPVSSDVRIRAHEHHVTPAKYLAVSELQTVDPTVTLEGCAGSSIGEIKERTRVHNGHHGGKNDHH